jgi:hypothetical protein
VFTELFGILRHSSAYLGHDSALSIAFSERIRYKRAAMKYNPAVLLRDLTGG